MGRAVIPVLIPLWLSGCAYFSSLEDSGDGDAGASEECVPYQTSVCYEGDVWWADSCGRRLDIEQECPVDRICLDGRGSCCNLPVNVGTYQGGLFVPYFITWDAPGTQRLVYEGTILQASTGPTVYGQALSHVGTIGEENFTISLQTNVRDPENNQIGPGVVFGSGGFNDPARADPGDGAHVKAETSIFGPVTDIIMPLDWITGPFVLELEPSIADANGTWFRVFFGQPNLIERTYIGALRFDGDQLGDAAFRGVIFGTPDPNGKFFYADTETLAVDLSYEEDGMPPTSAQLTYNEDFVNADVSYNPATGIVRVSQGAGIGRCGDPGQLF